MWKWLENELEKEPFRLLLSFLNTQFELRSPLPLEELLHANVMDLVTLHSKLLLSEFAEDPSELDSFIAMASDYMRPKSDFYYCMHLLHFNIYTAKRHRFPEVRHPCVHAQGLNERHTNTPNHQISAQECTRVRQAATLRCPCDETGTIR